MADVVLDSSAILAVFNREPGAEVAEAVLYGSHVSSLIAAEVATKLIAKGMTVASTRLSIAELEFRVHSFTQDDALLAAALCVQRDALRLSLAARACLVLAMRLKLPVVTADRAWRTVDFGESLDLQLIR